MLVSSRGHWWVDQLILPQIRLGSLEYDPLLPFLCSPRTSHLARRIHLRLLLHPQWLRSFHDVLTVLAVGSEATEHYDYCCEQPWFGPWERWGLWFHRNPGSYCALSLGDNPQSLHRHHFQPWLRSESSPVDRGIVYCTYSLLHCYCCCSRFCCFCVKENSFSSALSSWPICSPVVTARAVVFADAWSGLWVQATFALHSFEKLG